MSTGLGDSVGGTIIEAGATLRLSGIAAGTFAEPLTIAGTLACANSPVTFTGGMILTAPTAAIIDVSGTTPTVNGVISGVAGLRKTGTGQLTLAGTTANTFSGGLFVDAGILGCQKTAGIDAAPGPITIGDGTATAAELRLLNANQLPTVNVTLNGSGALFNTNSLAETIAGLNMTSGTVSTGSATLIWNGNLTTNASASPASLNGNLSINSTVSTWNIADGAATDDVSVNGVVSAGASYRMLKNGDGRVAFVGNSTFPKLRINFGTAAFSGTSSNVLVELNGGTLMGSGFSGGHTSLVSGGTVLPGGVIGATGALGASGAVSWNALTTVQFDIANATPIFGYDQLTVLGSASLGNAALVINVLPGFVTTFGDTFKIIDNDLGDAVTGTFAGLPEGALLTVGGATMRISYVGGDGNDVTLTTVALPSTGITRVWDGAPDGGGGASVDANWMTATNWVGDVAPAPGDALEFPAVAQIKTNTNNFPANTSFDSIRFSGGGYSIGGAVTIALLNGVRGDANTATNTLHVPFVLAGPQTFFADAGATLIFQTDSPINTNGQTLTLNSVTVLGNSGLIDLVGIVSGSGNLIVTGGASIGLFGNNTIHRQRHGEWWHAPHACECKRARLHRRWHERRGRFVSRHQRRRSHDRG